MKTNTAKQQQQKAVIYARVSSEEQVQGYSIQAQLRACHEWVMEHLLVDMAEFYSRNLSREIMKGLKQRALQGHLVFRPPFGYRKEIIERQEGHKRTRIISRPVVDEKAAPVVKRMFELYDKGNGYKSIAMILNREGYRTNKGHRFRVMFISRTLHNRAYIGILDYNRCKPEVRESRSRFLAFIPPSSIRNCLIGCKRSLKMKLNSFKTLLRIEPTTS